MARALTITSHPHHITFESFGVRVGVSANDTRVFERLHFLPPMQSRPCELADVEHHVDITTRDGLRFNAKYDIHPDPVDKEMDPDEDIWVAGDADLELVLATVEAHVHEAIALNAPEHLFLRAGAVLHHGRAIVLPGEGLSGKSTLVAALVRAGATAYSDEYAVFDQNGRLQPYTKRPAAPVAAAATNGSGGAEPAAEVAPREADAIVFTAYRPGAEWRPESMSRGESMLALLAHAPQGEDRPKETMSAASRVLEGDPLVVRSERGEAETVAPLLLAQMDAARSGAV